MVFSFADELSRPAQTNYDAAVAAHSTGHYLVQNRARPPTLASLPPCSRCRVAGESELIELEDDSTKLSPFPLVQCRNIYVLPGVPTLLQAKWRTLKVFPPSSPRRSQSPCLHHASVDEPCGRTIARQLHLRHWQAQRHSARVFCRMGLMQTTSCSGSALRQAHLLRDGGPLHPFHAVVLRLKTADETVRRPLLPSACACVQQALHAPHVGEGCNLLSGSPRSA